MSSGEMNPKGANDAVRIGNFSGFYGDRLSAMREMLTDGKLDVLTGDFLAELTMLILARQKAKDPSQGYAKTFLVQLEDCLELAMEKGVKIAVNAGGMNPAGLAEAIRELAESRGVQCKVAYIDGDDITDRADEFGFGAPIAANAYLGGFGIKRALDEGADIVVTGRVTDASLIVGAAAWHHGWGREDYDQIAGAMAAGHVIECGTQATGGNYAFFTEVENMIHPGFPIAEIRTDGSNVITKHEGTAGAVTTETVLSQLLYEIQGVEYAGPDATLLLDSIHLSREGEDRVLISGVKGQAPPPELKVSVSEIGGYRNQVEFLLTGLNIEAKAALTQEAFEHELQQRPEEMEWTLVRTDRPNSEVEEEGTAILRLVGRDKDKDIVGRAFSNTAVELMLGGYPGMHLSTPPGSGAVYGRYTPHYIPQDAVEHTVHFHDGSTEVIPAPAATQPLGEMGESGASSEGSSDAAPAVEKQAGGSTVEVPLGRLFGARSGDKGGNVNVGVWARDDETYGWLAENLTTELVRELLPEAKEMRIDRVPLPNMNSVNFVIHGMLGEGVAYGARFDPQAKGIGEWLRSRRVAVPARFLL